MNSACGFVISGVDLVEGRRGLRKNSSESVTMKFSPLDLHINFERERVALPSKSRRIFLSSNHS